MSVQSPAYFTGSDVRVRDPDLPKLHFAVAFKGASWTDPDAIPLMVIQSIIGAWNNRGQGGALPFTTFHHKFTWTVQEPPCCHVCGCAAS